ncbi:MAG: CHASE domain-containing protein [Aquabacterium sp.]
MDLVRAFFRHPRWQPWGLGGLTWLAYTLSGMLSVWVTSSIDQVAPFYLAAGVGLACVLAWGRCMLPALSLGSAAVAVWSRWLMGADIASVEAVSTTAMTGLGALLQGALAVVLVRRLSPEPLTLEHPREIGLFLLLAGPMACLVNATMSVVSMVMAGELPDTLALDTFLSWWMGDTMGVLVGTPLALTLIGQPAELWRRRRRTVGIPLLITAVVVLGVVRQVQEWKDERTEHLFQRDVDTTRHAVQLTLSGYVNALEAMRGLYAASTLVERQEFEAASRYWLSTVPGIQGIGWDERLRADELPAFEARQRAAGFEGYQVFDTRDRLPPKGEELVAVSLFEPVDRNAKALGYNVLSVPVTRDAFEQARREDKMVATAPLTLNQETGQQRGVVIYRAVYAGAPHTPLQRVQATRGAVFIALRMDDTLQAMLSDMPRYLQACLLDLTPGATRAFLAGAPACQEASTQPWASQPRHHLLPLSFGGRQWSLALWVEGEHPAVARDQLSRLMGLAGMALTAALGALLLVMTGHARRIEAAMQEARAQKLAADAANQAKSEFLSRMSHELRTPLNAVLGFAQVMEIDEQSPLPAAQKQRVRQIQQAGWHLLAMIDDVLDISRVDSGNLQLDLRPVAVAGPVQAALDMVTPLAQQHQVRLVPTPMPPSDWWVSADPTRLQQVLVNLLSNAIKYNRPGGEVRLSVTLLPAQGRVGERFALSVEDQGLGMSEAQQAQLFQPFNRLGRERSGTDGTGIGLVITRHLVQAMQGVLQVRSQVGQGSVFSVLLPRLTTGPAEGPTTPTAVSAPARPSQGTQAPPSGRSDASASPPATPPTPASPPPLRPTRHVLYVEDNPANSAVVQSALASRAWLRLTVAPTIEEGLAVLHDRVRARRPDLILLDLQLPDASGLELLHLLKANPDTADIPVIVISADAMPEQIDAALAAGAACYLTKPVQIPALLVQVDDLLLGVDRPTAR